VEGIGEGRSEEGKEGGREMSLEVRLTLLPWGFTSSRLSCGLLYCQLSCASLRWRLIVG